MSAAASILLLLFSAPADAPASLSRAQVRVGERVRYTVELPQDAGDLLTPVALPPLAEAVVLLEHGFEASRDASSGRRWFLDVLADTPGSYTLGPVEFRRVDDALAPPVRSAPHRVTVTSRFAGGEARMAELLGPLPPEDPRGAMRGLPWILSGAALVLLGMALAWGRRQRTPAAALPVADAFPELGQEPGAAAIRDYYALLSRRLRRAVARRFPIPAQHLAVEELAPLLREEMASSGTAAEVAAFLEAAERTRFAHRPTGEEEARRAGREAAALVKRVAAP